MYDDYDYGYDDYDYDYGYEDWDYDYGIDYDYAYSFAPGDWGYSKVWKDGYFCGVYDPEDYLDIKMPGDDGSYSGIANRDECLDWCRQRSQEIGGTCCANMYEAYLTDYPTFNVWCAIYDSEPGSYEYWGEDIDETYAAFYSATPLGGEEMSFIDQAGAWIEDTFAAGAKKMAVTASVLATIGLLNM